MLLLQVSRCANYDSRLRTQLNAGEGGEGITIDAIMRQMTCRRKSQADMPAS